MGGVKAEQVVTPETFAEQMRALDPGDRGDMERSHAAADQLMVDLLRSLGYGKAMDYFEAMTKWYA